MERHTSCTRSFKKQSLPFRAAFFKRLVLDCQPAHGAFQLRNLCLEHLALAIRSAACQPRPTGFQEAVPDPVVLILRQPLAVA